MRTHAPLTGLVAALAISGIARADAPGLPGTRRITPTHRVVAREPFPDHVFVLCADGAENRAEFVTVEPGRPLLIEFHKADELRAGRSFSWSATLVIAPRSDAPVGSAGDVARAAFAGRIGTATRYSFFRRDTGPIWSGDRITIDYEVRRAEAGGRLEVVRTTRNETLTSCCVLPLLTSFAALFGGVYVLRRWLRPNPQPTPPGTGV